MRQKRHAREEDEPPSGPGAAGFVATAALIMSVVAACGVVCISASTPNAASDARPPDKRLWGKAHTSRPQRAGPAHMADKRLSAKRRFNKLRSWSTWSPLVARDALLHDAGVCGRASTPPASMSLLGLKEAAVEAGLEMEMDMDIGGGVLAINETFAVPPPAGVEVEVLDGSSDWYKALVVLEPDTCVRHRQCVWEWRTSAPVCDVM